MSQIIKPGTGGGGGGGAITFPTDTGLIATELGGVLNILTLNDGANGITTTAPGSSNTVQISLTNHAVGTVTTVGAVSAAAITIPAGSTPGTYTLDVKIAGFAAAGLAAPLGCGYTITGAVRTTGAATVLIKSQQSDQFEEGVLSPGLGNITVSGNNILITVTGVAGYTIDWAAIADWVFVS